MNRAARPRLNAGGYSRCISLPQGIAAAHIGSISVVARLRAQAAPGAAGPGPAPVGTHWQQCL